MKTRRQIALILSLSLSMWSARAAADETSPPPDKPTSPETPQKTPPPTEPSLDFDLLGPSKQPEGPKVDEKAVHLRRTMLKIHQVIGFGLVATEAGSIITGQLNYSDKFNGGNSNRYRTIHQIFVYPTIGLATINASLGLLAPSPFETGGHGFDRMTLHKIGMFTAYAGWLAQLALGLVTVSREGFENQRGYATAHLAVGYVTLAGLMVGVGAIVF